MDDYREDREPFEAGRSESGSEPTYRSFFWPVVLIGIGAILLLTNLGVLPPVNPWGLLRLWPVLLILAGLDLIFSRIAPLLGVLLGLLVVAGVIVLLFVAPSVEWLQAEGVQLGDLRLLVSEEDVVRDEYAAPLDGAEEAEIALDLGSFDTVVGPVDDRDNLIEAALDHVGPVRFEVTGESTRRVVLDEDRDNLGLIRFTPDRDHMWAIGLTPRIPLDLTVNASSGAVDLDLSELRLKRLSLDVSSGDVTLALPSREQSVRIEGSSGDVAATVGDEADLACELDMSSGQVELRVGDDVDMVLTMVDASSGDVILTLSEDAAVRVEVKDDSSGAVRVPRELARIRGNNDEDEGVWETAGYDAAERRILIVAEEMSSGDLVVRLR